MKLQIRASDTGAGQTLSHAFHSIASALPISASTAPRQPKLAGRLAPSGAPNPNPNINPNIPTVILVFNIPGLPGCCPEQPAEPRDYDNGCNNRYIKCIIYTAPGPGIAFRATSSLSQMNYRTLHHQITTSLLKIQSMVVWTGAFIREMALACAHAIRMNYICHLYYMHIFTKSRI